MPYPMPRRRHNEIHHSNRSGWLRATVLGANDGILSTGALLLGVVGAGASRDAILTAGVAGLVAGAGSMALGEYISVSSQRDTERADRATEERELRVDPVGEQAELRVIYEERGLDSELADQVAAALMENDALGSHLRDELGLVEEHRARPMQAALSSFASFAIGAAIPILAAALVGAGSGWFGLGTRGVAVVVATMVSLSVLGALAAWLGGAQLLRGATRVVVGGALGLAVTYAVGSVLGTTVG